jgi:hypothetical protein
VRKGRSPADRSQHRQAARAAIAQGRRMTGDRRSIVGADAQPNWRGSRRRVWRDNLSRRDDIPNGRPTFLRGDASEKDHRRARSCDDRSDLGHCNKRFCRTAGVAGYRAAASTRSARAKQRPNISSAGYFGQPNPFSPAEGFTYQTGDSTEHGRAAPPASASI